MGPGMEAVTAPVAWISEPIEPRPPRAISGVHQMWTTSCEAVVAAGCARNARMDMCRVARARLGVLYST